MKKFSLFVLLFSVASIAVFGQSRVKATVKLRDGKTIDVYHFGRLTCESNRYAPTFTILRGKYNGTHTEVKDYKDISKLELSGFTAAPAPSVGNQKGKITAVKKNGVTVPLDDAELVMSCYGASDRYNEIRVQIINPLTDQKSDVVIEVRNIESITFLL